VIKADQDLIKRGIKLREIKTSGGGFGRHPLVPVVLGLGDKDEHHVGWIAPPTPTEPVGVVRVSSYLPRLQQLNQLFDHRRQSDQEHAPFFAKDLPLDAVDYTLAHWLMLGRCVWGGGLPSHTFVMETLSSQCEEALSNRTRIFLWKFWKVVVVIHVHSVDVCGTSECFLASQRSFTDLPMNNSYSLFVYEALGTQR